MLLHGLLVAAATGVGSVRADPTCKSAAAAPAKRPSPWAEVPMGKPDAILGLNQAFNDDPSPSKMNLGVGAYRDAEGKPRVLEVVRTAEKILAEKKLNKEYAPIGGLPDFVDRAVKLMLGTDAASVVEGRVAAVQTISGTGACRVAAELYSRVLGKGTRVYVPSPTWANHHALLAAAGLEVHPYRYWSPETLGLDLEGMLADLRGAPEGSVVLLHACAHNPTGVDPTAEQWVAIAEALEDSSLHAFFDAAYQGFASGDPERDAHAVRLFAARGHRLVLAQSFAKNFGLYGERAGCLSVVCQDPEERARVLSALSLVIRPMYSSPPIHGARIVSTILGDEELTQAWREECRSMADRIISMRARLRGAIEARLASTPREGESWAHVTDQIGMFCFSGMTPSEVARIREEHHVYITGDGRVSMAGVTEGNVEALADAIVEVTSHRAAEAA